MDVMYAPELQAFAARLNTLCDEPQYGVPAPGKGRQVVLGKMFGVSQNAARKWLMAEGMPRQYMIERIAKHFRVNYEWLRTGRGPRRSDEGITLVDTEEIKLIRRYRSMTEEERQTYLRMSEPWNEDRKKN